MIFENASLWTGKAPTGAGATESLQWLSDQEFARDNHPKAAVHTLRKLWNTPGENP